MKKIIIYFNIFKYRRYTIFFIFLIFSLYIIKTYKYEKLCLGCINNNKNIKCDICKNNLFFKNIKIHNDEETIDEIIKNNKSLSRFGDGEFKFILGKNMGFQKYNKKLAKRLLKILNSREKNLLIGINCPYRLKDLDRFNFDAKEYYIGLFHHYKFKFSRLLKNKEYYSSTISRFYIDYESKKEVPKFIKKLKQLWENREVVIVEGDKSRLGIGNDLFANMKSIQRIICPTKNAFNYYTKIIITIKRKVSKNKLILIALGPTATVLSYDLFKYGYQAIDIGHIDIEYEWFLRKTKKKIPIKNKFVNEKRYNQGKFTAVKDKNYYSQIIGKIP